MLTNYNICYAFYPVLSRLSRFFVCQSVLIRFYIFPTILSGCRSKKEYGPTSARLQLRLQRLLRISPAASNSSPFCTHQSSHLGHLLSTKRAGLTIIRPPCSELKLFMSFYRHIVIYGGIQIISSLMLRFFGCMI